MNCLCQAKGKTSYLHSYKEHTDLLAFGTPLAYI